MNREMKVWWLLVGIGSVISYSVVFAMTYAVCGWLQPILLTHSSNSSNIQAIITAHDNEITELKRVRDIKLEEFKRNMAMQREVRELERIKLEMARVDLISDPQARLIRLAELEEQFNAIAITP